LSLAAGGAVVAASAISSVAVGLFELIKHSAEAGGELFDLSQKTGFTVETLSGLSIVAKTTGSDIQGLSASLVIFQKNQDAASVGTEKQSKLFKSLSIDTKDNEKGLRQAFTALNKLGEGAHQTATAMQLFGRSGKDVLAIVKETNGDLDEAIKKYGDMGLIISTGAATASDKFNDVLEETTLQLAAVTRSIGTQLLPIATETLQRISADLAANKDAWSQWGSSISDVLRGVRSVASSEIGQVIGYLSGLVVALNPVVLLLKGLGAIGAADKPGEDFFGPGGAGRGGRASLPGTPEAVAAARRAAGATGGIRVGGGGGGRGGGGGDKAAEFKRLAEVEMRATLEALQMEEDGVERSYDKRKFIVNIYVRAITALEAIHHAEVLKGLDAEEAAINKGKDGTKKKIELKEIEIKRIQEANRHREVEDKLDEKVKSQIRERIVLTQTLIEMQTRLRRVSSDVIRQDLGGGSVQVDAETRDAATRPRTQASGKTRPRIATVDEQVAHDQIRKIKEQMELLAQDLTSIFSQSISDGFNSGIKSGLQTLAQGLLQIVQDIFLKKLGAGLSELLGGLATGGGGSGFWGGLLRAVFGGAVGGAAGGVGGGSSGGGGAGGALAGAIGRASGGPLEAGNLYKVHKDEYIVPSQNGFVIPKGGMGQTVVNHYNTFNIAPDNRGSYSSPKSKRQIADHVLAALQGAT
jgi:hypothetical protein